MYTYLLFTISLSPQLFQNRINAALSELSELAQLMACHDVVSKLLSNRLSCTDHNGNHVRNAALLQQEVAAINLNGQRSSFADTN